MATKLTWNGKRAKDWVDKKLGQKLDKIRFGMEADIKNSFGISPSSPGEPPGVITGRLKSSITTERERLVIRIGSTLKGIVSVSYALALELGTRRMDARPYLKPVWMKWLPKIKKMLRIK